jgi:magnesium transporter
VAAFEQKLQAQLMLTFFIPAVVYIADAVGTQTVTVTVRGISVGVRIEAFAAREALTGIAVGATLALVFLLLCLVRWQDYRLAAAVVIALFMAASSATLVAMSLP